MFVIFQCWFVLFPILSEIIVAYEVRKYRGTAPEFKDAFIKLKSKRENQNRIRSQHAQAPTRHSLQKYKRPPRMEYLKKPNQLKPSAGIKDPMVMQENLALFFTKPETSLNQGVGDFFAGKYNPVNSNNQKPLFDNIIVAPAQPTIRHNCEKNAGVLQNLEHSASLPFGLQSDNINHYHVKDLNSLETGGNNLFHNHLTNNKPDAPIYDQAYETNIDSYAKYADLAVNYQNVEHSHYRNQYKDALKTSNYDDLNYPYGEQPPQNQNVDFGGRQSQIGTTGVGKYTHPKANDFVTPSHEDILQFSNEDAIDPQYVGKVYAKNGDIKFYSTLSDKDSQTEKNPLKREQQTDFKKNNIEKVQKKRRKIRHHRLSKS